MLKVPGGKTKVKVKVVAGAYGIKLGYIDGYSVINDYNSQNYAMIVDVMTGRIRPIEPAHLTAIDDFPEED